MTDALALARLKGSSAVRSYKPGKFGKGLIQSENAPQAMIWRVKGGWNGNPHHADVSEALQVVRPNVAFHVDKGGRFYFHSVDPGFVHPKDPAKLAAHVHRQYPELTWGKLSAEEYEQANGLREGHRAPKTLAMNGRALRPFEQGAHLHVLDWTHSTVRHRFQAAGAVQVKAATKAIVSGKVTGPPQLPALEAALTQELRKLYAVGHATVRSELQHQETRAPLPIGLSAAPSPPNLRKAGAKKGYFPHCANCEMFDHGVCWGYGNWPVKPNQLCDSYERDPEVKTLAAGDAMLDPGSLRARARLTVADVAHQIYQAVQRARLQGISDKQTLKRVGRDAGNTALAVQASHHAGGAINSGRVAAAKGRAQVIGARYTSVLDKSTCGPCADADTGELIPLGDPRWVPTPNPACLGGGRCRCIHVYQLASETHPVAQLPPDDFPSERRQPDRPSGVSALPVAQVGVGGS